MSDLHQLPLVGHDLPAFSLPLKRKARVFKDDHAWRWTHGCGKDRLGHNAYLSQKLALRFALLHVERCR